MAIASLISTGASIIEEGVGFGKKIFGGGKKKRDLAGKGAPPPSKVRNMLSRAKTGELNQLRSLYRNAYNKSWKNAKLLSFDAYGGANPSKNAGKKRRLRRKFDQLMQKYVAGSGSTGRVGKRQQTGTRKASSGFLGLGLSPLMLGVIGAFLLGAIFLFTR